jgi:hypothetical protein
MTEIREALAERWLALLGDEWFLKEKSNDQ